MGHSQINPTQQFDTIAWGELREKYEYRTDASDLRSRRAPATAPSAGRLPKFVEWLLIVVFSAGLLALIWWMRRWSTSNVSTSKTVSIQEFTEDQIATIPFSQRIQELERNQQFQMALRFQYLYNLQQLQQAQLIRWRKEKTNRSYLEELTPWPKLRIGFASVLAGFERSWYGNHPPSASDYFKYAADSQQFREQVQLVKDE